MAGDHFTVIAPGRVNLLGEHVDYCGGPVLPVAIDRAVRLEVTAREDRLACIHATDLRQGMELRLDRLDEGSEPTHVTKRLSARLQTDPQYRQMYESRHRWELYPASVAWALQSEGLDIKGLSATYTSTIPMGAGLSSSAAVEAAFALAWQELGGWSVDRMALAKTCQRAENEYVGVQCGIMDQFAVLHGVAGHALYLDTRTLLWEPVPLPKGTVIVIADTGDGRELANSAYDERRSSCEEAYRLLRERIPGLLCLADLTPDQLTQHSDALSPTTLKRARHVVEECARVKKAVPLLRAGDAAGFGQLMYDGHASLRDLFEVSTSVLDTFVNGAHKMPGCCGARLTGAGFGGCTVNLVEEAHADEFVAEMERVMTHVWGETVDVFVTRSSEGARVVRTTP